MMKKINEQKLQAFAIGAMGKRPLSRREQEEQRKREDQEAAAHAFKEFVETFQEAPSSVSKVWVKAGTYDAGSRKEDHSEKGKLYKPSVKLSEDKTSAEKASEYARLLANESKRDALLKKNTQEKKKSNLELFKEELRQIQEEREERHKYKSIARQLPTQSLSSSSATPIAAASSSAAATASAIAANVSNNAGGDAESQSSTAASGAGAASTYREGDNSLPYDSNGDPNTNLYLGNLSPKISEQQLMEVFGRYGPLASIKIMWPRSEEEKSRGRNCGFVAYMSRKDAERALKACSISYDMKLGWGKAVPIPTLPIYIPPALLEYTMPPPPSGLPFNAQPPAMDTYELPKTHYKEFAADPDKEELFQSVLYKSVVKVVMPTERPLLALIHRMIEFVVREGPMFEAMIMRREIENPMFRFLFENESPAHIYYRWKLFSLLQGDTPAKWRQKEFRMFKDGSIWKPPPLDFFTQGMPDELIDDDGALETNKGALSNAQRDRLEDLIRHLTLERAKIGDAMIFCIEHAEAADEICECIAESISGADTLVSKKIARLYLASDILHNCSVKVSNASFFRKAMERNMMDMFKDLNTCYMSMDSRLKAEGFKTRVLQVFRAWEDWAVYPREFITKLKNVFLGLPNVEEQLPQDIDGAPFSGDEKEDEDLDGVPLDGAALLKSAMLRGIPDAHASPLTPSAILHNKDNHPNLHHTNSNDSDMYSDIDGVPLEEDIDGIPLEKYAEMPLDKPRGFIPSKWETVDPDQVEAQAITTSKWDTLDPIAPEPPQISADYDNSDGSSGEGLDGRHDEMRRIRLREIEVKIMQYQDELEMGKKSLKSGWTMQQQLEHYRRKLIKKTNKEIRQQVTDSELDLEHVIAKKEKRSQSPTDIERVRRSKKSKRSDSPLLERKRSPHSNSRKSARDSSLSPTRSVGRSKKRSRSNSDSDTESPKRRDRSPARSKYDLSPRRYRSPSPPPSKSKRASSPTSTRSRRSPEKFSREASPSASKYARHRSDKHKHKHKY